MRPLRLMLLSAGLCVYLSATAAESTCPTTAGSTPKPAASFPESEHWHGSEALAVILPENGNWGVTGAKARIAVKLFVWRLGFEPGMETNLSVSITAAGGGQSDAVVKGITNAHDESLGGWAMLAGIDFPSEGCWEISLDYSGQSLTFVVETIDFDRRAIIAANNSYIDAIVAANLEELMTFYAADAVLMSPNMAPLIGKQAIGAAWADAFSKFDYLEAVSVLDEVIVLGDWAYGRGHYVGIAADIESVARFEERLSFSGMWHKDESGSWKIARDMYNASEAP